MKPSHTACSLLAALVITACGDASSNKKDAPPNVSFVEHIRPLIQDRCINCHHTGALMGELNLGNRTLAFADRTGGPVIVAGDAANSPFYQVLTLPVTDPKAMPPMGHQIDPDQVELIRAWIDQGAHWPEGAEGTIETSAPMTPQAPTGVPS